jgi:hypothetical protein
MAKMLGGQPKSGKIVGIDAKVLSKERPKCGKK